ncbi:MAG: extracellular solute-binding protein [Microbacterium sp.]|jgi:raffinose/stachyose/melibiose transport system substrate-binding protein|uniref:ABC transporter substrate-binding protein n=1 Tax=Microbacterium sp. TaxID=51671 RepID=UPI00261D552E|nr:extracellular solute-binding protein [Microbacterium sp.]MDF2562195.1 extracellular solute-binding protein [Microbacterium sp.]
MLNIRRVTLATGALAVGALAITACAPSAGAGNDAGDDSTITVWGWRQEDATTYEEIFKTFEEAHPGVDVEYVPYLNTEYDTILATGLKDASGPDVAQLRSYGLLQPLVESGDLVALDDEIEGLGEFSPSVLDGARGVSDGAVYGVPFAIQTLHVIYNTAIFADLGLDEPTTWDEMTEAFDTIKASGVIPLANTVTDTWMLPIEQEIFGAGTYGGTPYLEKMLDGDANFTDQPWVDSVGAWTSTQDYWGDGFQGTSYEDAQALFTSGQAAAFPGGIWELANFRKANPDLELGIFNVPAPDGSGTPVPGYVDGSFGVSNASDNKDAALELVEWMASPEFGQAFSDELAQISPVPGVTPTDELLAEAVDGYAAEPSPYITYAYFSGGTPTAWDLASSSFSSLILGEIDAAGAAGNIQQGIDQWFTPRS